MKKFGIFKKLLLAFLSISLLPLIISSGYSLYKIKTMNSDFVNTIRTTIEDQTQETIELQAVMIASKVENYLEQCESELLALKELPVSKESYYNFNKNLKQYIWTKSGSGKNISDERYKIWKYKEIVLFDENGNEKIKILDGMIINENLLTNFENNTKYELFKENENFYTEAKKLRNNSIYVTHLVGDYLSKTHIENYNNDLKKLYFNGIFYFSTPIYDNGIFKGVLSVALDHRHIMEFTQHILPNNKKKIISPDYSSGDYAFMFDDEGWIITHPKLWDIKGYDEKKQLVKPYSISTTKQEKDLGLIPFNLDFAGFIHSNYPIVSNKVRKLKSGSMITKNVSGTKKIMAFAPIIYSNGVYKKYGIFGGITIGSHYERFNKPAEEFSLKIKASVNAHIENMIQIGSFTILLAVILSWFISRNFSLPLIALAKSAEKMIKGQKEDKLYLKRNDEIGVLAKTYDTMVSELTFKENKLISSMNNLKKSKSEIEKYAEELEFTINIQKTIQKISNKLGTTFSFDSILKFILKDCVDSLSFDRAILYLKDDKNKYLEFRELYGFDPSEEKRLKKSKYNLERYDCIETKVARTGKIIFIEDFENFEEATKCDKKIRKYSKSNSFVYIPLIVKEKIIGILGSDKLHSLEKITKNDINYLQIITNQIARVIETTQLYQKIVQERNFRDNILNNMLNSVITTNVNGVIISVNNAAIKLLKIKSKELNGMKMWDLFPDKIDEFKEIEKQVIKSGSYKGYNHEVIIKGKIKYITIFISTLKSSKSDKDGYIVIIQDTTTQKKMNNQVQKLEKLASIGQFAAGIAHEIRNPLTGISLFLDDLFEQISGNKEMTKIVSLALNEIERLDKLINEILTYSSHARREVTDYDIVELVKSTIDFTENECTNNSITVSQKIPEEAISLEIDAEKIRQALLNLLSNAIKAIPENGGEIFIEIETDVKNSFFSSNINEKMEWIKISISDTGIGIPRDIQANIFEPFFTTGVGGTGLGLSITQSIITKHDGILVLENKKNYKTTFAIYLPR